MNRDADRERTEASKRSLLSAVVTAHICSARKISRCRRVFHSRLMKRVQLKRVIHRPRICTVVFLLPDDRTCLLIRKRTRKKASPGLVAGSTAYVIGPRLSRILKLGPCLGTPSLGCPRLGQWPFAEQSRFFGQVGHVSRRHSLMFR